ncbi:peptidase inhibitor family I36 protein [Micromonospora humida]|uniref:peptidase inhibitor family I36 protein n=1 Tax=Micromonospora humida TaxID=2809018 RepID=UPI0034141014
MLSPGAFSRASGGVFVAAAVLTATLGVASPALANDGNCGPGDLCLFEGNNMSGGRWDLGSSDSDYASGDKWWGTTISINDQASSGQSKYSFWDAYLYEHSYYRGSWLRILPGEKVYYFSDYGFNNKASSNDY